MTDYQNILVDVAEAIATITVNRPEKLNALNQETIRELDEVIKTLAYEPSVRAVIVTGAGEKAFVAGADIAEIARFDPNGARQLARNGQHMMRRMETMGKPVIAAINGFALGGGCELALACTFRFAADNARIGLPEINLGLMPGFAGTQRLSRLAGRTVALELALTGEPIDAQTAMDHRVVDLVVPADDLMDTTRRFAAKMTRKAPIAVRHILAAIHQGADVPFEQAQQIEAQLFALTCATEDMREGTSAFLEKRQPTFKGS